MLPTASLTRPFTCSVFSPITHHLVSSYKWPSARLAESTPPLRRTQFLLRQSRRSLLTSNPSFADTARQRRATPRPKRNPLRLPIRARFCEPATRQHVGYGS